ncbi:inhibitor of vertebrate lysozyme family protein [Citrobacter portucalensis]|uniref:Ivy family c-type lysozyme inhibitor n=1 Tax=Citrobacter portucalensis TaxID=1639133 RepID=UPI001078054B|nr:Ivy family c-type lysozyme inhibitor [Citrobacter portucalensis]URR13834.1 inhibitor of vertebrate lysozyme family protein [Citrobacter portucalensis]
MKRKFPSTSVKWCWLSLSVALMAPTTALATVKTAVEAKSCQPENNTCPYPFDLYKTDSEYKKSFDEAMNQNGLPTMLDEMNGPAGPMEPVKIDGKVYLKGFMCEDDNCGSHNLTFLYQPDLHNLVGFYINGKDGQWVNTPSDGELKVLRALVNGTAEPTQTPTTATTSNDAPPPNTIWGFTGGNGDTLWSICGGKQNSCVIVGNTKHVAAVLNHKSASGCALGDFYIIDKDARAWQQRDTGTCSPNAWVRKGSIKGGQYLSVDIGVGNETVIQYPIGYWSDVKEFTGPNRPSWEKAKQAAKQ